MLETFYWDTVQQQRLDSLIFRRLANASKIDHQLQFDYFVTGNSFGRSLLGGN